jgi:hypothetical protein
MSDERLDINDLVYEYSDVTHADLILLITHEGVGVTGWEQRFLNDYTVRGRTTFTQRQSEVLGMIFRKRVEGKEE